MKPLYQYYTITIEAGQSRDINVFGNYIACLSNTSTTPIKISIEGEPEQDLPAGLGLDFAGNFTYVTLRNTTAAQITLVMAFALGRVQDSRLTLTGVVSVNLAANSLQTDAALIALKPSYLINNAAAVNKGGGLVGVPLTGQPFATGESITIAGSTNYNGTFTVDATSSANEVVITAAYVAEAFAGTETVAAPKRSIAANTAQREIMIVNVGSFDVYLGDSNVDAANTRGILLTSGSSIVLSTSAAIYAQATTAGATTLAITRMLYS